MFHSFSKKIIVLTLIFTLVTSLFLPLLPVGVFAEDSDFCNQVKNATCDDDLKSLSEDSRLKDCGDEILNYFQKKVKDCNAKLEAQKNQTQKQLNSLNSQQTTAQKTLNNLTFNIKKLNTEIASLNLSLAELENAIQEREKAIKELDDALGQHKAILSEAIRQIYEYNTLSYIEMLLGYRTLSDFNQKLEEIDRLQKSLKSSMEEIRKAKEQMEKEKEELTQKKKEQEQYKAMREMSKQSLALRQEQQQYLIEKLAVAKTPLEKEMARIEAELMELRTAMSQIERYLAQWVLVGQVNWSTIFSAVQRASSATGVRPALLLGILQIESRFGTGLGTPGRYQDYCNWSSSPYCAYSTEAAALESICQKFGYKPTEVPMSSACAIGPSQFLPCTWLAYGGGGNPWNLNDAVMAMARKLNASGGAEENKVDAYNPCKKCAEGFVNGIKVSNPSYVNSVITSADAWQDVIDICGLNLSCPQMQQRLQTKFSNIPTE
ncbi:MAG TPA: lytic murein transglycosylase [Candidatus Paceibacterota bacterium]|nr:lytic murein transglycosylase [Candidatus Pacearchaeota archaeon]HRR39441.1 lytic murein transglycosylase [Candidatus Paceibacterota bacterium]